MSKEKKPLPEAVEAADWLRFEKFQLQLANLELNRQLLQKDFEAHQKMMGEKYQLEGARVNPQTFAIERPSASKAE